MKKYTHTHTNAIFEKSKLNVPINWRLDRFDLFAKLGNWLDAFVGSNNCVRGAFVQHLFYSANVHFCYKMDKVGTIYLEYDQRRKKEKLWKSCQRLTRFDVVFFQPKACVGLMLRVMFLELQDDVGFYNPNQKKRESGGEREQGAKFFFFVFKPCVVCPGVLLHLYRYHLFSIQT